MNILNTMTKAVIHTPVWVWCLFAYLLFIGYKSLKPHTTILPKLFVLPAIFVGLSLHMIINQWQQMIPHNLIAFAIAAVVGILVGWLIVQQQKVGFYKKLYLVYMPGTCVTLILVLAIFVTKYFFGYMQATNPALAASTLFQLAKFAASGLFTGLSLGRLSCYSYRFMHHGA